jgi:DsbC/DsbD-like thiol-disulfide interchange protein
MFRIMKISLLRQVVLTALLLSLPAIATAQQADAIRSAGILPGWRTESGTRMAAFALTLDPGWKTYWRAPGDSGIPPQFDWAGSTNVAAVHLHWPRPEVFSVNGLQQIGYHDKLVLPLEVTPLDPALPMILKAQIALGICKDICVPATLQLSSELSGAGAPDKAINAALKARPESASHAGLVSIACDVEPIKDGLALAARIRLPDQGGPETVVFETGDVSVWVAPSASSRDGATLISRTEMVPASGAPFALDRSAVIVTVLGKAGAVEILGCPAQD